MASIAFDNNHKHRFIQLALCVLMVLTIAKDLIHSIIKDYHFYLSESMLFGSFWLLFVPLVLISQKLLKRGRPVYVILAPLLFSVLHIGVFALIVFSVSALFFAHTFGIARVFTEAFGDHGIACFLVYGAVAFIFPGIGKANPLPPKRAGKIRVKHHNRNIFLSCENILYLKTERPYIALVTKERTYLSHSTLQALKEENLHGSFVQIHKSTVVNTDFISSYTSRKNGDYDVQMTNGEILRVSRNYNTYFISKS